MDEHDLFLVYNSHHYDINKKSLVGESRGLWLPITQSKVSNT